MYLRNNDLLNNAITCTLKLSGIHTPEEMTERKYVLPIILARSAKLPEGLYILPMFFLYFFFYFF